MCVGISIATSKKKYYLKSYRRLLRRKLNKKLRNILIDGLTRLLRYALKEN